MVFFLSYPVLFPVLLFAFTVEPIHSRSKSSNFRSSAHIDNLLNLAEDIRNGQLSTIPEIPLTETAHLPVLHISGGFRNLQENITPTPSTAQTEALWLFQAFIQSTLHHPCLPLAYRGLHGTYAGTLSNDASIIAAKLRCQAIEARIAEAGVAVTIQVFGLADVFLCCLVATLNANIVLNWVRFLLLALLFLRMLANWLLLELPPGAEDSPGDR